MVKNGWLSIWLAFSGWVQRIKTGYLLDIEFGLDKGTFQGWGLFQDWDLSVVSLTIQSWSLILQHHNQFGVRIFFFDLQTFFPD